MIRSIAIAATVLLLGACATSVTQNDSESSTPPQPESYFDIATLFYTCDNFTPIEVRFFPNHGVAVLIMDGNNYELQKELTYSGFWYSNSRYSIRGEKNLLRLDISRRDTINCTENR